MPLFEFARARLLERRRERAPRKGGSRQPETFGCPVNFSDELWFQGHLDGAHVDVSSYGRRELNSGQSSLK